MVWRMEEMDAYQLLAELLREEGVAPLPEIAREAKGKPCLSAPCLKGR